MSSQKRVKAIKHGPVVSFLAPVVFGLILFLGWFFTANAPGVKTWVLPSPSAFIQRFSTEIKNPVLWHAVWTTAQEALLGCLVGAIVALPLAYLIYRSQTLAAAVEPFLGATQAIPAIALAPLLMLWVGYGTLPIVVLCALMVFFPILVSATLGFRHLDSEVLDAARLDGADGWKMLVYMEAPLALYAILAGLRNGFTLSVTGAVVGEMVMGGHGLGLVLTSQRNSVDTVGMFVAISLLCVMAMTAYSVLYAIERRFRRG